MEGTMLGWLQWISRQALTDNSMTMICLALSTFPLTIVWAITKTRRLLRVLATQGRKSCDKLRGRYRFVDECASTIAVIGTIFSLASAFRYFEINDVSARQDIWLQTFPILKEVTSPSICRSNAYLETRLCPELIDTMTKLGDIEFDINSSAKIDRVALVKDLEMKAPALESRLPHPLATKLRVAIDRIADTVPNELRYRFVTIIDYEAVAAAAVVGASHKLAASAFDARIRFRVGRRLTVWPRRRKSRARNALTA